MSLSNFKAYTLSCSLYRSCLELELPGYVRDQLFRAALSVVTNLAEGSGKSSPKDRCRFYQIALGSLRETQALLELHGTATQRTHADQTGAAVFCLVRALNRAPERQDA